MSPLTEQITRALAANFTIEFGQVHRIGGAVDIEIRLRKAEAHRLPVTKTRFIRAVDINTHGVEACFLETLGKLRFDFSAVGR